MNEGFDGKNVVITGAGGGIGRELCRAFTDEGGRVIAIDSNREALDALMGVAQRTVTIDLTDRKAVEASAVGPVDVLVNNAGVTALGRFDEVPAEAFDRVLAVNLTGSANITRTLLPELVRRKGRIAVLSSVAGFAPLVHRTAYSASKHALHGMFESLRAELASEGVSVTMVCPTFVDTGIETRAVARSEGGSGEWSTTGRHLTPGRVAAEVVEGLRRRKRLVLPGLTAKAAYAVHRLAPAGYEWMMRRRIG